MQNSLKKMLARMFADKKRQRRIVAVVCVLSVLVITSVFTELMQPVITLTPDPVCGQSEHAHSADCFENQLSCGIEESDEHAHSDDCYKSVMVCGKSEHMHVEACYPETIEEQTVTVIEPTEAPAETAEASAVMSISEGESTEAPVEVTAEPTVEVTAEPSAEVTVEPTAEVTAEPTVEVTAEPAPIVAVTAVSADKVFVGQSVTWNISVANETELTYYIADETGMEIVSGTLDDGATCISWLADRTGMFTMTVTATNATGSVSANSTVTVEESEELVAAVLADSQSCFAGEEIIFHFAYSGGVEPAAISIVIAQDGEILAELSEFAETVTVTPAEVGNTVTTVTAEIIVTDCVGNTVTGVCEIPCAVRTRETESDWEKSTYVELTGEWPEDLIAVAETQLGYEESEIDFIVNAEGERQGYTRYGQWYGSTYGEWCAMFVSFDLNYAEIPESYFPREANCEKWISALKACGLYEDEYGYEPEVGDLVFFDMDGDEESDHVGIVTNITDYSIETIEGNVYRDVRRCVYDRNDEVLYGYGCVLEAYETYLRDELDLDLEAGVGSLAIVTAESANLRAEADAESELVAQLPAETVVMVNASEQNRAEIWYQVSVGEQSGWLRSDLVEINYLIEEELVPAVMNYEADDIMLAAEEAEIEGLVPNEYYASTSSMSNNENYAVEASVVFVPVDSEGNELTDVEAPATVRTTLNYTGSGYRKEFKNTDICPEVDRDVGAENVYSVSLRVTTDGVETEAPANYVSIFSRWNSTPFTGCYFTYGETYGTCVNYLYNSNAYFVVRYIYNESQTYTATFVNEDIIVDERTLNIDEALGELPEAPAADDGYIFIGWAATNADGENVFATEATVITEDTVFEAVYAASATVEFVYLDPETNDLTDLCEDQIVAVGTTLTLPTQENFNKNSYPEGAIFTGWQILNGETFEAIEEPYTVSGDTVFYGMFKMLPTVTFQYTVTGDDLGTATTNVATYRIPAENATLAETIAANTGVEVADAQLPECPLTMDTKYFSHWATAGGAEATLDTVITADTVYEAVFADKVLVKFQYSYTDSDTNTVTTVEQAQCYAIPGKPLSAAMTELPTVEVPRMRFMGWCLNETEVTLDTVVTLAEGATEVVYTADLRETININFVYQDVLDSDNDEDCEDAVTYMTYTMLKNGEYTTALRTVVDADGNETVEYLTEIPEAPYFENYKFVKWIYVKGETSAPLEDLTVFNNADADINVTAVYEYNEGHTVTFHDIDPDGNEKLHEGVESIDLLVPDGEMLADYLPEVALVDRQASDVIKWYTIDENNVKTEFNPNQTVTSDLELYTYTYRIVLTLSSETEATQSASLLDLFMPTAYAATVTPNGNQLIIEIAAGETLNVSDFVVKNDDGTYTDYMMYTWYTNDGSTFYLSDLIGTEVTESISVTAASDSAVTTTTFDNGVYFYVCIDGDWTVVGSTTNVYASFPNATTRYYVTLNQIRMAYSEYGYDFFLSDSSVAYCFPHSEQNNTNVWNDVAAVQNYNRVWCIPVGASSVRYNIYYLPTQQTMATTLRNGEIESMDASVITDNSFWSVTANGEKVAYILNGNTKTLTLENPTGASEDAQFTWALAEADQSDCTFSSVANADGTTTITIENITDEIVLEATEVTVHTVRVVDDDHLAYEAEETLPVVKVVNGNTATITVKNIPASEDGKTYGWSVFGTYNSVTSVDNGDGTSTITIGGVGSDLTVKPHEIGTYTISVQDSSNQIYTTDETIPVAVTVTEGAEARITVKKPTVPTDGSPAYGWSVSSDAAEDAVAYDSVTVLDNGDGTLTYIFAKVQANIAISPAEATVYTIIYQIPDDSSELEQIDNYGVNYAASGQSWVSLPKIQESDEYEDVVVLVEGEEYIVLEPDSSTAKSRFVTANKEHTDPTNPTEPIKTNDYFYATYTFVGWKVDGDAETTVNARDGLTEEELKVLDEDGNGIITLTPDWSINPDGDDDVVDWTNATDLRAYDTCSFWVVLSTSVNDSMENTNNKANYYSDCLYTTDVDNPNDIAPDPLIAASTTTENTDAAANARIRKLATDPYEGVSLGDFPSDAAILANLVDWLTRDGNDDAAVYVDGVAIDPATLTTENYTIRWYVFKYQGDGWHVDGKLIPRNGMIRVTKTFYGNAEAIAAAKANFSITATETSNTSNAYTLALTKKSDDNPYGYVEYDATTQTYTWLLTVKKDTQYTITESGYEVSTVTVDGTEISVASIPEYMTTADGQWHAYDKNTGVTVTAKSYWADTDAGEVEAVNLMNSYIPTNTMILRKVDGNTGLPVNQAVSFELKQKSSVTNEYETYKSLYYVEDTDTYYLYQHEGAEHVEDGVITVGTSGSVVIVGLKEATQTTNATGEFALTEVTPPTGYNRIPDVEFTITTTVNDEDGYDSEITVTSGTDANNVVYAEATNEYTLRVKNFPMTSRVIVEKVWPSGETALPVTFQLYRNGVSMGDDYKVELDGTKDTAETDKLTYVWEGLPLYVDGAVADYEIIETWIGTAGAAGSVSYDPNADITDGYENYVVVKADPVYTFNSDGSTGSSPYNAETGEYANVVTLVVTNRRETGKIDFDKVDPSGNPVAGATFTLYRADGQTIQATATSNSDGDVEFSIVPSGTYYLKETGTPDGYCENTTQYKVVITGSVPIIYAPSKDANGNTVYDTDGNIVYDTTPVTSIVNVPASVNLILNKVDDNDAALAGAEFNLLKENDAGTYVKVDGYFTTDGTQTSWNLNDLETGNYHIVETKAPDGYYMMSETIEFTIEDGTVTMEKTSGENWKFDKTTLTFTVTNTPGMELPSTGGAGTYMFTIGGLLLMAASLLYGIGQRRKRERGDEI